MQNELVGNSRLGIDILLVEAGIPSNWMRVHLLDLMTSLIILRKVLEALTYLKCVREGDCLVNQAKGMSNMHLHLALTSVQHCMSSESFQAADF